MPPRAGSPAQASRQGRFLQYFPVKSTLLPWARVYRAPAAAAPMSVAQEVTRRRTFAIISHPDAGKTTLTEKLLLFAGAIHIAGSVKARKASRHATSDWMEIEKQRGISVASSVMQMDY